MNETIGIMGCGWLGLPLGESLLKESYKVFGTTTSEDKISTLEKTGITSFLISISEDDISGDISGFLNALDTLIIDIPPKLRGKNPENFVKKIKLLVSEIQKSNIRNILFVSSTSVYGNHQGEVTETSVPEPTSESGKQLLACEEFLSAQEDFKTTIVRFGGLIGPNRHPVTMLSGRENLSNGNDPVNLIHREDCIHLISQIIKNGYWGEIFNGVYPNHPPKKTYYAKAAQKKGIPAPKYQDEVPEKSGKVVLAMHFEQKGHQFKMSID